MQPWMVWLGAAVAPAPRFTAWDAFELGALALLAASSVLLWRRARRVPRAPAEGLPLVVAAAAVAAVIDEPHRIVGVVEVREPPKGANLWSLEGRRHHFASHQLR